MQHFSEIPNSEPLEFPEFSATSSGSAGRRKCPACADLASSCARPAAALRDYVSGLGGTHRMQHATHDKNASDHFAIVSRYAISGYFTFFSRLFSA